jgi:hypothetical protein
MPWTFLFYLAPPCGQTARADWRHVIRAAIEFTNFNPSTRLHPCTRLFPPSMKLAPDARRAAFPIVYVAVTGHF